MNREILIEALPETETKGTQRIICRDKVERKVIATIYADSSTEFTFEERMFSSGEIDNINFVKNNFWFIYENLMHNQSLKK